MNVIKMCLFCDYHLLVALWVNNDPLRCSGISPVKGQVTWKTWYWL